jgi:hypothetical protein
MTSTATTGRDGECDARFALTVEAVEAVGAAVAA